VAMLLKQSRKFWSIVIISIGLILEAPGKGFSAGTCAIETDQKPFTRPSATPFSQMSLSQMALVNDFSRLSEAVYHDSFKSFVGATGTRWDRIAHTDFEKVSWIQKLDNSGLKWDLVEGRSVNGERVRVVVFAGTDINLSGRDLLTDAYQLWALAAQYLEALNIARQVVDATAQEPGVKLYFTGHSLGGGLAQFVAAISRMPAIVFNSAGLGLMARELEHALPKAYREAANTNITNVRMTGDLVHRYGLQLGQPVELTPPPGVGRDPLTLHGQGVMVETIKQELDRATSRPMVGRQLLPRIDKPVGGVSIDPEVSFAPTNLSHKREQFLKGRKE